MLMSLCGNINKTTKEDISDVEKANTTSNQIDVFKIIGSLAKTQVDTNLLTTISEDNPAFNLSDWDKIKTAYRQWREDEIRKGFYVESCLENPEVFIEKYGDKWMTDSLRYALPNIPEKFPVIHEKFGFDIDTFMVDMNFDGKQDIIFKILPDDCLQGNGLAAHPPIYLTVLSRENTYIVDNTHINKVEKSIENFREKLSDREYSWISIDKIKNEQGIISISGNSCIYLENDASCCPSVEFDFTAYMDKTTNGYIQVNGVYKNEFEETENKFELKLRIE